MRFIDAIKRARRDERGLTLAELLVTVLIFALVLTVVTGTFVTMVRATTFANATDTNVRTGSDAMDEMTRVLHAAMNNPRPNQSDAPAFSVANSESATFSTAVNMSGSTLTPEQVSLTLDSSRRIVETVTAGQLYNSTYYQFTGAVTTRVLSSPVTATPTGGDALFVYFDANNNRLTPDATGALSSSQISSIASVQITLRLTNSNSTIDNSVTLTNQVGLPNLTTSGQVSSS
jgi:prepilin-type N-terminal cleavage/methylation domain-containing protein